MVAGSAPLRVFLLTDHNYPDTWWNCSEALTGPVGDLVLALTRRQPVDQVTISGDRALVDHWPAHTAAWDHANRGRQGLGVGW